MPFVSVRNSPLLAASFLALALASSAVAGEQKVQHEERIEDLSPPPAAVPPRIDSDEEIQHSLETKRQHRHKRDDADRPPPVPYAEKRHKELLKETLKPHPLKMLMELSMNGSTALTTGTRAGYTSEPSVHFNLFMRKEPKPNDTHTSVWWGLRVAPFTGTGFYKRAPGAYGLTYFGPMIGLGKVDPVPGDDGVTKPTATSGEEPEIPSVGGWLVSFGLAGVSKAGNSESGTDDSGSDFSSKGAAFDAPGAWIEARYLRVMFGALGFDYSLGVQLGAGKTFIYAGFGIGAWD